MRKYVLVCLLLFQFFSANAQIKVSVEDVELRNDNGDTVFLLYLKGSKKPFTGITCEYALNDSFKEVVSKELNYVNGRLIGPWRTFYPNGTIHEEGSYNEDSQMEGKYYEYYENGNLKCEGEYWKNGLKNYGWSFYYEDGKFNYGGDYLLNQMNGPWIYKDEKGNVIKRVIYDSGTIKDIETKPLGKKPLFGTKAQIKVSVEDAELRKDNGDTVSLVYLKGSKKPFTGITYEYALNDSFKKVVRKELNYVSGRLIGPWRTFYPNGALHEEGNYNEDSKLNGKYYEYYENGKLKCEGEYRLGLKNYSWLFYYEDGNFSYGGQYLTGQMFGPWIYKDEKGNVLKRVMYQNGIIKSIETNPIETQFQK